MITLHTGCQHEAWPQTSFLKTPSPALATTPSQPAFLSVAKWMSPPSAHPAAAGTSSTGELLIANYRKAAPEPLHKQSNGNLRQQLCPAHGQGEMLLRKQWVH